MYHIIIFNFVNIYFLIIENTVQFFDFMQLNLNKTKAGKVEISTFPAFVNIGQQPRNACPLGLEQRRRGFAVTGR
jgi:hypothetical protein